MNQSLGVADVIDSPKGPAGQQLEIQLNNGGRGRFSLNARGLARMGTFPGADLAGRGHVVM
jgi:hypothetical protein